MEYKHIPVLFNEVLDGLNVKEDGIYVDGTLGGGGHSEGILKKLTNGKLIVNDLDTDAIANAKIKFSGYGDKISYIHDDYKNLLENLDDLGIDKVDGILLDLGISSYQIDNADRGFSYMNDAPLDMRMNQEQSLSAYTVVNEYSEDAIIKLLYDYGEEKYSKYIARKIVAKRQISPIQTTLELSEIIASCYPSKERFKFGNPAKRTFQAIRIEVNNELGGLEKFIYDVAMRLKVGGRMCVIAFHSLEDRMVKRAFLELEKDCICDKRLPVCVCNKRKEVEILTKKPISGSIEADTNKRSESAKLRIIEKV